MSAEGTQSARRRRPDDGGADRADRQDRPREAAARGAAKSGPADAYGALLRAIVGQQLSTKAARTIYLRVLDLFGGTTPSPEQLLEATEADLRGAGLSGRKVEYVRDLADHVLSGELELERLDELERRGR